MPGSPRAFLVCESAFSPDTLGAEFGNERVMGLLLGFAETRRKRSRSFERPDDDFLDHDFLACRIARGGSEAKGGLTATDHLDVDIGQQFGVEKRAVLRSMCIIDAIAAAKRIERVGSHRMLAARHRQCVEHAVGQYRWQIEPCELSVYEAH